jgi:YfiH family protein
MIRRLVRDIPHHRFESLAALPWLGQAVLTRQGPGGGDWTLSFGGPEGPARVAENLGLLEAAFGFPLALVGQVHGTEALVLSPGERYAPKTPAEVRGGFDAIVFGPGQGAMIRVADCQAVILASPETKLAAVVHSGWRGSAANVLGRTVSKMAALGAKPENTLAAIGPSLGPCCAEMINYRTELPEELWSFKAEKKDHFDFWAISRFQLERAGLAPENIETAGVCTRCDDSYYSHRRGDKGRFAVLAGVTP